VRRMNPPGFSDLGSSRIGRVIHASPSKTPGDRPGEIPNSASMRPARAGAKGQRRELPVPVTHRLRVDVRRIHNRRVIHALMHANIAGSSVLEERGGDAEVLLRVAFGADETTTSGQRESPACRGLNRRGNREPIHPRRRSPERPSSLKKRSLFREPDPFAGPSRARERERERERVQGLDAGRRRGGKRPRREEVGGREGEQAGRTMARYLRARIRKGSWEHYT